jgi:hypothetical protein
VEKILQILKKIPGDDTTTEALKKAILELQGITTTTTTSDQQIAIHEFMDPNKNALVKSFKSVQGQGLAGVIESLTFDWLEGITWETNNFMKAPKRCVVSISFAPIHDISPGIDNMGYNRSPIYPVGWQGQHKDNS